MHASQHITTFSSTSIGGIAFFAANQKVSRETQKFSSRLPGYHFFKIPGSGSVYIKKMRLLFSGRRCKRIVRSYFFSNTILHFRRIVQSF
jgi:hypothetical protein